MHISPAAEPANTTMLNSERPNDPYREPGECIRSARGRIAQVIGSLDSVSSSCAEQYADILVDAARQLQSAAALIQGIESPQDKGLRKEILELRREIKLLSSVLVESDRLVTAWIGRIGGRSGYTERGGSSPLFLVRKVNVTA